MSYELARHLVFPPHLCDYRQQTHLLRIQVSLSCQFDARMALSLLTDFPLDPHGFLRCLLETHSMGGSFLLQCETHRKERVLSTVYGECPVHREHRSGKRQY